LVAEAESVSTKDGIHLFHRPHLTGGFVVAPTGLSLEAATDQVYRRLFEATDGLHLYRLWNYVPHINGSEDHLENYRHFCRARSLAFEARFGQHFQTLLPASSAVGALAGPLAVAFVAGPTPGRHFENPAQVPAFDYPAEHGPRPPSFSRATVATTAEATHVFISGTAAIRGHGTIAPGQVEPQLDCTLDNLRLIGEAAGVGAALGAGPAWRRRFKVYLRHAADLPGVVPRLESELFRPDDRVVYLNADICRTELVVEIEASLTCPA
jgi:enamine deaminase RidA (YjgF/YER057c/UK114 family)